MQQFHGYLVSDGEIIFKKWSKIQWQQGKSDKSELWK